MGTFLWHKCSRNTPGPHGCPGAQHEPIPTDGNTPKIYYIISPEESVKGRFVP